MKIELNQNKIFFVNGKSIEEIHPFWLRERIDGDQYLDKKTQQRLFDPSKMDGVIKIKKVQIKSGYLEIDFNDGVNSKIDINKLEMEFYNKDPIIKSIPKIKWDSSLKTFNKFIYKKDFFESKEMYDLLISFYKFGFVIIKNVPTDNNYIVKFANSIGSVRRTNFGEHFNVRSKRNPNDLAYTNMSLSPHTDNPYRNPVPCIQLLHCIENEVDGGHSTLVDGFTVSEKLKKEDRKAYDILTEVKVRFKFIDKSIVLEDWSELIKLDENKEFKQVRFSPRLDYVPILEKKRLDIFYKSRKKLSDYYNSKKNRIEFKLEPKDLIMMDNYRVLHGRTAYNSSDGNRFLQGCYIDFDSTEGKLRHLKRKFNF